MGLTDYLTNSHLKVLNKKTGQYESISLKKLTDKQIRAAIRGGKSGVTTRDGYSVNKKGQIYKSTKPDESITAWKSSPFYREKKSELDYNNQLEQTKYDSLMGSNGARGSLWGDWNSAVDAITRGGRSSIAQTNADVSGRNIAGSGIARRALKDIAAELTASTSKENTDFQRRTADAAANFQNWKTNYNSTDSALRGQAAKQWAADNEGLIPEASKPAPKPVKTPTKKFTQNIKGVGPVKVNTPSTPFGAAPAPATSKAPPGMKFVKNPAKPGKYKLVKV